jgi:hypothetical protein
MNRSFLIIVAIILITATLTSATTPYIRQIFAPPNDDLTGDHPLATSFMWQGNGDVRVYPIALSDEDNPSGEILVDSIPAGSTIAYAMISISAWSGPVQMSNGTLNGAQLAPHLPICCDTVLNSGGFILRAYRWDVTEFVTGNGNYTYQFWQIEQSYGLYIVVIYENLNLPNKRIVIQDGSDAMSYTASTSIFNGFAPGTGTLSIFTQAGDQEASGHEAITLNGNILAGPGNVFLENLGPVADFDFFPSVDIDSSNVLTVSTGDDWIGYHLAILTGPCAYPGNLALELSPNGGSPIIPPQGGSFTFTYSVANGGPGKTALVTWSHIRFPDLTYSETLLGPAIILPIPNSPRERQCTQEIPAAWQAGEYRYIGYVAMSYQSALIIDSSSFTFTKLSTTDGGPWISESTCEGDLFDDTFILQPSSFSLSVSPNPFNPTTTIHFDLPKAGKVTLEVFDINGCRVGVGLDPTRFEVGTHEITFDGSGLPSGIYLYRLQAGANVATGKMVLLK